MIELVDGWMPMFWTFEQMIDPDLAVRVHYCLNWN
jgi:hypothetical protein